MLVVTFDWRTYKGICYLMFFVPFCVFQVLCIGHITFINRKKLWCNNWNCYLALSYSICWPIRIPEISLLESFIWISVVCMEALVETLKRNSRLVFHHLWNGNVSKGIKKRTVALERGASSWFGAREQRGKMMGASRSVRGSGKVATNREVGKGKTPFHVPPPTLSNAQKSSWRPSQSCWTLMNNMLAERERKPICKRFYP